jgi:hypothetical protein
MTEQTTPRPRAFWAGWIAAAVLLVAAAVAGVYASNLQIQLNDVELRLVDAVTKLQVSEERLAAAAGESDAIRANLSLLSAPDVVDLRLAGTGPSADATGRVFISRSKGLIFSATKLAPLPDGRAYQLWLLSRGAAAVSVGTVHPSQEGNATAAFDVPADVPQATGFSVSIEPEGGSKTLTGTVVLASR